MNLNITTERSGSIIDYIITGKYDDITAEVEKIYRQYPPAGYSTYFNWPPRPDAEFTKLGLDPNYKRPREISPGVWAARGYRATSCD